MRLEVAKHLWLNGSAKNKSYNSNKNRTCQCGRSYFYVEGVNDVKNIGEVEVHFIDGGKITIKEVNSIIPTDGEYRVVKNGYNIFFNKLQVKYIGRVFDIDNQCVKGGRVCYEDQYGDNYN